MTADDQRDCADRQAMHDERELSEEVDMEKVMSAGEIGVEPRR